MSETKTLPELHVPLNPRKNASEVTLSSDERIPKESTKALLPGAGLSIIAAFCMIFLVGMELDDYLRANTYTTTIEDMSFHGDYMPINFDISFPALPCEFASVDVCDVFGTNMLNITETVHKYPIDSSPVGSGIQPGLLVKEIEHDEEVGEDYGEGSVSLNVCNFDRILHRYPILVVDFYAPWCLFSQRLKPSWEKAAKTIRERYDPKTDGRILLGMVDCTEEPELCRRHHIQGYPSIRIFRNGSDVRGNNRYYEDHDSYYGPRDTDSLVKMMEALVAPISLQTHKVASYRGCRIEGSVHVKKVSGDLTVSARSATPTRSFDASWMNMSHAISHFSFGEKISPSLLTGTKQSLPNLRSHDQLRGMSCISRNSRESVTIKHHLQVVRTQLMNRSYELVEQYRYTAYRTYAYGLDIPAVKFHFELSPMQVFIRENYKSFSDFITNVCAIIGSVSTVAGILYLFMLPCLD